MAVWESLLLTALGGGIGTAGTLLGMRMQAREAGRVRRQQCEREDRFRLHKDRIEAYSSYYVAAGHMRKALVSDADLEVKREVRRELWHAFTTIVLIGERTVLESASTLLVYADRVIAGDLKFDKKHYGELIWRLQRAGRADLIGVADLPTVTEDQIAPVAEQHRP